MQPQESRTDRYGARPTSCVGSDMFRPGGTGVSAGRFVTGAEMAWGAAAHAVKYIAHQLPNLPTHRHAEVGLAVRQLDRQFPALRLFSDFGQAEALHRHFYRGNLQDHQARNPWRRTQHLIANLLSLPLPS